MRAGQVNTGSVDQKAGPLQLGQADGIACRTMEMFEAFDFAHKVLENTYWVNKTTFWKPSPSEAGCIVCSERIPDVEENLSHMLHVIFSQARVRDFYLEKMEKSAAQLVPHYNRQLASLVRDAGESNPRPVVAQFERHGDGHRGEPQSLRARDVVGCDSARSDLRQVHPFVAQWRIGQPCQGRDGRAGNHRLY